MPPQRPGHLHSSAHRCIARPIMAWRGTSANIDTSRVREANVDAICARTSLTMCSSAVKGVGQSLVTGIVTALAAERLVEMDMPAAVSMAELATLSEALGRIDAGARQLA